jgi:MFS family permease
VALTSVFPYAYDFMQYLLGAKTSNAAFYAGIFIAVFSLAESLTGFWWGALSDRIGRKPVLLLGCGGTMISLFVLGFSSNIWMAVLGRALGGALNGNIGVVQTMVGEMVTRPEHERMLSLSFSFY